MRKTLNLDLNASRSVQDALDALDGLMLRFESFEADEPLNLCESVAGETQSIYDQATYAGANSDIEVTAIDVGTNTASLVAHGEKVAFIEFGTGISLGQGWPGAGGADLPWPDGVAHLGELGKKHGANPPWRYVGEPGKNPPVGLSQVINRKGGPRLSQMGEGVFSTHGNPPAAAMAAADAQMKAQLENDLRELVKI